MNLQRRWLALLTGIALVLLPNLSAYASSSASGLQTAYHVTTAPARAKGQLHAAYGRIPLSFEANRGQAPSQVRFLAHGGGYTLFLASTQAIFVFSKGASYQPNLARSLPGLSRTVPAHPRQAVVRMQLVGANARARVEGLQKLPGTVNYFIGKNPEMWRTSIPTYARVLEHAIYPGVDMAFHTQRGQLEYDFILRRGVSARSIHLRFQGAKRVEIDTHGDLMLHTTIGTVTEVKPVVYQMVHGIRRAVAASYLLEGAARVGFRLGAYDPTKPVVIDPTLIYSTYLGGSGFDEGEAVALDSSGNAYVTGDTYSTDFPATGGTVQTTHGYNQAAPDAFVAKLNAAGSSLVYATYLGGNSFDQGFGIAVDSTGSAYVAGDTESTDFPVTSGALQTTTSGYSMAFVTKLAPTGSSLEYSTYLGGSVGDYNAYGIAIDQTGDAYVTGSAQNYQVSGAIPFPTTPGAYQTAANGTYPDAFVSEINPAGYSLVYSTYLGGSSTDEGKAIALDSSGNAYVTGDTYSTDFPTTAGAFQTTGDPSQDAFVTKLNPTGAGLVYSSYLGGDYNASGAGTPQDVGTAIAVDSTGAAFVTGYTVATNFPTTPGALQPTCAGGASSAYVTKITPSGTALAYSTCLGGNTGGSGIRVDATGDAILGLYVGGGIPTTPDALQPYFAGGPSDAGLAVVDSTGSRILYSSYFGGTDSEEPGGVALDSSGNVYLTGGTRSGDLPTTAGAYDTTCDIDTCHYGSADAFVAKFNLGLQTNAAPTFGTSPGDQTVQYSDYLTFRISASDSDGDTLTFGQTGLPSGVNLTDNGSGTATISGYPQVAPGTYPVTFTVDDGHGNKDTLSLNIVVTKEDAVVSLPSSNPTAVQVTTAGGSAPSMTLVANLTEASDDGTSYSSANDGNISNAVPVTYTLAPVGSGTSYTCTAVAGSGGGRGGTLSTTCTLPAGVAVNVYQLTVSASGSYQGSAQSVLAVYDPSLGFATGGGWFIDPSGYPANFGFNAKYNSSGQLQGHVLYIEHTPGGDNVLKSNSMGSMAITKNSNTSYAAKITGKATYNGVGNYSFILTAIDNGDPGAGIDQLGMNVEAPNNNPVSNLTFNPTTITGGNIQMPHK